jgi:hypothetical protein
MHIYFWKIFKKSGSFNFDIKPQTFKQHILNNDGLLVLFSTVFFISITMPLVLAKANLVSRISITMGIRIITKCGMILYSSFWGYVSTRKKLAKDGEYWSQP